MFSVIMFCCLWRHTPGFSSPEFSFTATHRPTVPMTMSHFYLDVMKAEATVSDGSCNEADF